ncbi:MAG: DegT/DnrJ/EryC1/StrS family aminotransferase [Chthonomonadales bacterium]
MYTDHSHRDEDARTSGFAIPHSRPYLGDDLEVAAREITASGMIGPGRHVERFEAEMALLHNAPGAVATNSGTSALHLALLALDLGPGDEIILPSYVCTAVLNAVRYVGAQPVLADIREDTFNIDPADVRRRITARTRAIIVPHMFGVPADVPALQEFGLPLIEDCAQSLGASIGNALTGSLGDFAVFSFYATKVITTGEGGMVLAQRPEIVERMRDLRDYDEKSDYVPRYNYHMSNLAAAIGYRQLRRLPDFVNRRRSLARLYGERLAEGSWRLPEHHVGSIFYRYVVQVDHLEETIEALAEAGIQAKRPVFEPLHHFIGGDLPVTEHVYQSALSLPLYPALTDADAEYVAMIARNLHHAGDSPKVRLEAIGAATR